MQEIRQLERSPAPTVITRIPVDTQDTERATALTQERMAARIRNRAHHPLVELARREMLRSAEQPVTEEEALERVFWWSACNIRVRHDEHIARRLLGERDTFELLIEPAQLLAMDSPEEDCDGFTALEGALILGLGIPVRIVTIKADPDEPWRWSHVYLQARLSDGRVVTIDGSHGPYPGWEAPERYAIRHWPWIEPRSARAPQTALLQGLGQAAAPLPWWQTALNAGVDIARLRYGTPPAGTYIQTGGGVISSGVPGAVPGQYPGTGVNVGVSGPGISTGVLLAGAGVLLGVMLLAGGGRRR